MTDDVPVPFTVYSFATIITITSRSVSGASRLQIVFTDFMFLYVLRVRLVFYFQILHFHDFRSVFRPTAAVIGVRIMGQEGRGHFLGA